MGIWQAIKRVGKGVAKVLLPALARSGLEQYRKKNPKSGWIVDAVESALESNEQSVSFQQLTPEKKAHSVYKQVRTEFPDMDPEEVRAIANVAVMEKLRADKKRG